MIGNAIKTNAQVHKIHKNMVVDVLVQWIRVKGCSERAPEAIGRKGAGQKWNNEGSQCEINNVRRPKC